MLVYRKEVKNSSFLPREESLSIIYHDIFDYPLTLSELIKWSLNIRIKFLNNIKIIRKKNFYLLKDRNALVVKRLFRERISERKIVIAKKASKALSLIPTIKMVGITGALAMKNADDSSDIDLMVVTAKETLWTTRMAAWIFLKILGFQIRKPQERNEKDKLCLNLWLDENDLVWEKEKRNIFTAHEIAQVEPLLNKDETYEKFIYENIWVKKFWPNAITVRQISNIKNQVSRKSLISFIINTLLFIIKPIEPLAFKFQCLYMKKRITNETIAPTKALFHPLDWSKMVESRLKFY